MRFILAVIMTLALTSAAQADCPRNQRNNFRLYSPSLVTPYNPPRYNYPKYNFNNYNRNYNYQRYVNPYNRYNTYRRW